MIASTCSGSAHVGSFRARSCSIGRTGVVVRGGRPASRIWATAQQDATKSPLVTVEQVDDKWATEVLKELVNSPELGKRGEAWTAAQLVAFLLVAFPPGGLRGLLDVAGWLAIAGGLALTVAGQQGLGKNLTPLPKPRDSSSLVTDGIYKFVRHPMYGGIGLAFVGLSLACNDDLRLVLALLTLFLLDRKASYEEELLVEKWGAEYEEYKRSSKKLIPYIW